MVFGTNTSAAVTMPVNSVGCWWIASNTNWYANPGILMLWTER